MPRNSDRRRVAEVAARRRAHRAAGVAWLVIAAAGSTVWSQSTASPPPAAGATASEPASEASEGQAVPEAPSQETQPTPRLGRYRIGRLYLTPTFTIGTIGLDTNTFYTPSGPRADVTASGGPGLDAALPLWRAVLLRGSGSLIYLYYLRTASERRLMGAGSGRLEWKGARTELTLEASTSRQRARPSLEVDRRVLFAETAQRASLRRTLFGRMRLMLSGKHDRREADVGEDHLGVDLRSAMGREGYTLGADLDYGLTVKTSLAATYEHLIDRFPHRELAGDVARDRLMGGLRTDFTALISGEAMAGVQWVRPPGQPRSRPRTVCNVDALLNLSVKTHIGGTYRRDYTFSILAPGAASPTLLTETYGARLDKDLVGDLNLQAFVRRTRLSDDGTLHLVLPNGQTYAGTRRDTADEAGGDLGYRFRGRLRVGVAASYIRRRSTVAYFGIHGLLVGLSVRYNP